MKAHSREDESPPAGTMRFMRSTLPDGIYRELRQDLMAGAFPPGEQLTLRGVAARMGTSIMPVREALRRLTAEGALEPLSNGTIRVPLLDTTKIGEITEIRMAVEGLAARRAARLMTAAELKMLEGVNQRILRAIEKKDTTAEGRANEEFHFHIYRAARSEELLRVIENLWLKIGPFLVALVANYNDRNRALRRRSVEHHDEILKALRNRNETKAEAALRADLAEGASFLTALAEARVGARPRKR